MIDSHIRQKILESAISLKSLGINDLAWKKTDAEHLINSLLADKIGILGGDVYRNVDGRFISLGDNWACNPIVHEGEDEYFLRSKKESLAYIGNYPIDNTDCILFSLVFSEYVD